MHAAWRADCKGSAFRVDARPQPMRASKRRRQAAILRDSLRASISPSRQLSGSDRGGLLPSELEHAVQDVARDERSGLLRVGMTSAKSITDSRVVAEARVLDATILVEYRLSLPLPTTDRVHATDRPLARTSRSSLTSTSSKASCSCLGSPLSPLRRSRREAQRSSSWLGTRRRDGGGGLPGR